MLVGNTLFNPKIHTFYGNCVMKTFLYQIKSDELNSPIHILTVNKANDLDAEIVEDIVDKVLEEQSQWICFNIPHSTKFELSIYQYETPRDVPLNGVVLVRKEIVMKPYWESDHMEGLHKMVFSDD